MFPAAVFFSSRKGIFSELVIENWLLTIETLSWEFRGLHRIFLFSDAIYQAAPVTTQQNRSQSNDSSTSAYQAYEALMEPSTSGTSMMQITGSQNTYASTSQCLYAQYPPSSSSQPYSYNSQNFNAFGCSNGPLSKPVPITHAGKGQAQIENEQEHVEDTVRFDISSEWAKIRTERLLFYSLYADRSGGLEPQRRPHHTVQYDGGNGYEPVLGAVVNSDGSLTLHDGTHLRANGTILRPNGVMINFDGSVCPPDGFVYDKFGNVRMPGGEYLFRNGYILGMDGIFIRPDTSVFNLPKRSMSLAQCIDMICSDLIVKFYVIPSDVTPAAQYAADAITCHNAFRAQTRSLNNPICEFETTKKFRFFVYFSKHKQWVAQQQSGQQLLWNKHLSSQRSQSFCHTSPTSQQRNSGCWKLFNPINCSAEWNSAEGYELFFQWYSKFIC